MTNPTPNQPSGSTFRIVDLATNRQWDVEAIQPRRHHRTEFGDSLTDFCNGAITEDQSQISEQTHDNVRYVSNPSEVGK